MLIALRRAACLALVTACSAPPPAPAIPDKPPAKPAPASPAATPAPASPEPTTTPATPGPSSATPGPATTPAAPEPSPPTKTADTPPPPFCVQVDLGLDLRALPTHVDQAGVDMFVRGEAQDLRDVTPGDPPPRIYTTPGAGLLQARFDAATASAALTRCEQAVDAYLKTAPTLPILMTPAADVTVPCRPCPGPP